MKKTKLTAREREIVNLSASIAAGCSPCITYHVKKCLEAGLSGTAICEVASKTKQLCDQAMEINTEKVFQALSVAINRQVRAPSGTDRKIDILTALAASYSLNNTVMYELFLTRAPTQGLGAAHIAEISDMASFIHDKAKAHVDMVNDEHGVSGSRFKDKEYTVGCTC